jgi:hypothetical protein
MVEFSEDLKGSIAHSNKMRKSMMSSSGGSFANKAVRTKTMKWDTSASHGAFKVFQI